MSSPARSAAWRPLLWLSPAAIILIPFFFLPIVLLLRNSLNRDDPLLLMVPDFSFANYAKALGDGFYLQLFVNTIGAAAVVAIAATVIAYPFSYFIARYARRSIGLVIWAVYMPLFVSVIVRVLGWMIVLADSGLLNNALLEIGIIQTPLRILFEVDGMLIGMIHRYLPLGILPLFNAMKKIPDELHWASANLGGSPFAVIRDVVLPLSIPGIAISLQLVFAGALSDFVLPQVLGSPRFRMLAPAIYAEATSQLSMAMASTLAVLMLAFIIALIAVNNVLLRRIAPWANSL